MRAALATRRLDRVLVIVDRRPDEKLLAATIPPSTRAAVGVGNISVFGHVAGSRVHVVDRRELADAIASRVRLERRGRRGHDKMLSDAWIAARFADRQAATRAYPATPQAAAALGCGALEALLRAVEEPLTPGSVPRKPPRLLDPSIAFESPPIPWPPAWSSAGGHIEPAHEPAADLRAGYPIIVASVP